MSVETNYSKYRGKCKKMSEELVKQNNTLTLVRGYYHEPIWGTKEQHWWCKKPDGVIIDPTKSQFPSGGIAEFYEEFNGKVECSECGEEKDEEEMSHNGRYSFCSNQCHGRFVGVII